MKNLISTCCFGALVVATQAGESSAPVSPTPMSSASAGDIFLGANAREDAWYGYAGANYAFNGDKSAEGFISQLMLGYGEYEYDTLLGGVEGEVSELDLGIGYQWLLGGHRVALLGALNLVDHDLSGNPIDIANNDVEGSDVGFKPKLDIWNTDASEVLYGGTFTYSTANDSYWNRIMVGPRLGCVYVGPEFIFQGNEEYEEYRAGLALAGLQLSGVNLGLGAGYAWADPKLGTNDQEGIYGSFHLSFDF